MILVPALMICPVMIPPPVRFIPELWSFGYFGVFYLLGWMLYQNRSYIQRIEPYWKLMLILSIIAYALYYLMLPKVIPLEEELFSKSLRPGLTLMQFFSSILEAYISFYMTFVFLIVGEKYFGGKSKVIRLISDSSYWIYIIHLPLVFFIQFIMTDISISWYLELTLSSAGVAFIGMGTYLLFVRWTPIGWLLNGRKSRKLQASFNSNIIPQD
jgi:peptidoglycan/LPS O-acetylase OafA/YrhL